MLVTQLTTTRRKILRVLSDRVVRLSHCCLLDWIFSLYRGTCCLYEPPVRGHGPFGDWSTRERPGLSQARRCWRKLELNAESRCSVPSPTWPPTCIFKRLRAVDKGGRGRENRRTANFHPTCKWSVCRKLPIYRCMCVRGCECVLCYPFAIRSSRL